MTKWKFAFRAMNLLFIFTRSDMKERELDNESSFMPFVSAASGSTNALRVLRNFTRISRNDRASMAIVSIVERHSSSLKSLDTRSDKPKLSQAHKSM